MLCRRSNCVTAACSNWQSSATPPTWSASPQVLWRPDLVLAWGEPYDSPLWQERTAGNAYLCRESVCDVPVSTPEALYEKITGRLVPEGTTVDTAL